MPLTLEELGHIGQFMEGLAGLLLLAGGWFALVRYRQTKRSESIRWLTELGGRLYQFSAMDASLRRDFEYEFGKMFAPAIAKWLVYPELLTPEEKESLTRLDGLLNFFELVCHASAGDRALSLSDREATFQYWFDDVMKNGEEHVLLRLYVQLGFENLRTRIGCGNARHLLAVYGTLREGATLVTTNQETESRVRAALAMLGKPVGACQLRGRLVQLPDYPGLVKGVDGVVEAQLYKLPALDTPSGRAASRDILKALDSYEGFSIANPSGSEYIREYHRLVTPAGESAWVYVLNDVLVPPDGRGP